MKIVNTSIGFAVSYTYRSLNFSMVAGSSRKSSFVPTRTMDVDGAWCEISGYHLKRSQQARQHQATSFKPVPHTPWFARSRNWEG